MNQKAKQITSKQIIEHRFNAIKNLSFLNNDPLLLKNIGHILEMFIEHPTKPGYKRKDIEYFLKLLNNE